VNKKKETEIKILELSALRAGFASLGVDIDSVDDDNNLISLVKIAIANSKVGGIYLPEAFRRWLVSDLKLFISLLDVMYEFSDTINLKKVMNNDMDGVYFKVDTDKKEVIVYLQEREFESIKSRYESLECHNRNLLREEYTKLHDELVESFYLEPKDSNPKPTTQQ
jgi:hypothetical protein